MRIVKPEVRLIAWTHFEPPIDVDWETDADGGEALAEFAGRACYQSWDKPNPKTATNEGYLRNILDVGHFSVIEHGSVTFYLTGVSRSFTHELVRHRHFSYSQESQRYVSASKAGIVVPHDIADNEEAIDELFMFASASIESYNRIVETLGSKPRKLARQAARSVLPNAMETKIVVSGNFRAWRHFINTRATEHADREICEVAVIILKHLMVLAPNIFGDYQIAEADDGREVAVSLYK